MTPNGTPPLTVSQSVNLKHSRANARRLQCTRMKRKRCKGKNVAKTLQKLWLSPTSRGCSTRYPWWFFIGSTGGPNVAP